MPEEAPAAPVTEEDAICAALARANDAAVWDKVPSGDRGSSAKASSVPPKGYRCLRCGVEGHYVQNCPTNGNPEFDRKRKYMKGVPMDRIDASVEGGRLVAQNSAFARQMWFLRGGEVEMPDVSVFTAGGAPPQPPLALPAPTARMPTQPIADRPRR